MPNADADSRAGVLITRPATEGLAMALHVERLGYRAVLAPVLTIEPCRARLSRGAQAVLVTSANALAALPVWLHTTLLYAVGDATAARAQAAGFTKVASASGNAEALAGLVIQACRPDDGPLLLACGANQGRTLATTLRRAGYTVWRRTTYRAVAVQTLPAPAAQALAEGSLTAALFFAAQTAQTFLNLVGPSVAALRNVTAVAIGEPCATVLATVAWRQIHVARLPTLDEMLARIE